MIDVGKLASKAQEAFDKRNYDYSIDLAKQIIELSPGDPTARKILRASQVQKCELQKIIPNSTMAYIVGIIPVIKILLFSLLKKYNQVLMAGEEFLTRNPYSIWGRVTVAEAQKHLNYIDSALEEYLGCYH